MAAPLTLGEQELQALGDQTATFAPEFVKAWQRTRQVLADPLALDQFGLQCTALSETLSLLASRSHRLAEDALDQEA